MRVLNVRVARTENLRVAIIEYRGLGSTEYRDGLHGVPAPKKRTTFGWRTCCKNVISFSISEEMAVLLCVVLTATE